jgi:tRNA U55 pseudouridine synthase TruB
MLLGVTTDSMDTEGQVISRLDCRNEAVEVKRVLESLVGEMD